MDVKLVMFRENGQRRDFVVAKEMTIGRGTDAGLQIPLATISRKHCQLTVKGQTLLVRDLGSSNGTFVNDSRVQESPLKPGDRLQVGPVILTVVIDGKPEQIKPVRSILDAASQPVAATPPGATVDSEQDEAGLDLEEVAETKKSSPAAPAPVEDEEIIVQLEEAEEEPVAAAPAADEEEVAEQEEEPQAQQEEPEEEEAEQPVDPLAALQAMTRPKKDK